MGHSCVDVDSDGQTSPPLQLLSFLVVQFWEPSHLWDNTHQVVWIWGISCLISYLGMPTAHDQETLDQWDIVAPHAGRRETLVPLEAEFKCSLPVGVWREAPLSFSSIQKVSYTGHPEWAPRSFSDHSTQCSINRFPSCRTPFEAYTNNSSICYPYISMTCFSSKHLSVITC